MKARWALGLWVLLAVIVFNVTFDWQTRKSGHAFVRSQIERRSQGQALLTVNDGYRPMVRRAARDSSLWLALIGAGGIAMVAAARNKNG
jgi:hypothetical protein